MYNSYFISTDKSKLDILAIHDFLSNRSYWGKGRTIETVQKSIENSICFGAYDRCNRQAGFARVLTDFTVFAYLLDVFILEDYRKKGIGKQLIDHILNDPALQAIPFWRLDTDDSHGLYRRYGFREPEFPEKIMEKRNAANKALNSRAQKPGS